MTVILLVLILVLSLFTLLSPNLIHGVFALSGVSLLSAVFFYILNAPDVAITEAAVGAGVSTVIFVGILRRCESGGGRL